MKRVPSVGSTVRHKITGLLARVEARGVDCVTVVRLNRKVERWQLVDLDRDTSEKFHAALFLSEVGPIGKAQ